MYDVNSELLWYFFECFGCGFFAGFVFWCISYALGTLLRVIKRLILF